jgi:hypothetical protein
MAFGKYGLPSKKDRAYSGKQLLKINSIKPQFDVKILTFAASKNIEIYTDCHGKRFIRENPKQ